MLKSGIPEKRTPELCCRRGHSVSTALLWSFHLRQCVRAGTRSERNSNWAIPLNDAVHRPIAL